MNPGLDRHGARADPSVGRIAGERRLCVVEKIDRGRSVPARFDIDAGDILEPALASVLSRME